MSNCCPSHYRFPTRWARNRSHRTGMHTRMQSGSTRRQRSWDCLDSMHWFQLALANVLQRIWIRRYTLRLDYFRSLGADLNQKHLLFKMIVPQLSDPRHRIIRLFRFLRYAQNSWTNKISQDVDASTIQTDAPNVEIVSFTNVQNSNTSNIDILPLSLYEYIYIYCIYIHIYIYIYVCIHPYV